MMNKYILFVIFYAFIATQSVGGRINVKQNENSTLIVTTPGATTTGAMLTPGATTPGATTTGAMLTPGATTPGATTTGAMLTPGATTPGATTTGAMLTTPGVSKAPTLKFSTTTGYEYPCYKGSCYNDDYCCGGICCAVCINLVCQNCLPSASQCTYNSDCCSNICYNFYCLDDCSQEGDYCADNNDCCDGFHCVTKTGTCEGNFGQRNAPKTMYVIVITLLLIIVLV